MSENTIGILNTDYLFPNNLPKPDNLAKTHSIELAHLIIERIHQNKAPISFADYMKYCLYEPGLGYYSAGSHKLGASGDFITSPEISKLFGMTLANYIKKTLKVYQQPNLIELGAGTGKLAIDILTYLEKNQALPDKYYILEISADLKDRQKKLFQKTIPHLLTKIEWLSKFPEKTFQGILLANEVIDALPVTRFSYKNNKLYELKVDFQHHYFNWAESESNDELNYYFSQYVQPYIAADEDHYYSEACLILPEWLKALSQCFIQGEILFIDYGFLASSFYHPDRKDGTLMCHYQHRSHDNPFILPGLQDITAHVNFSQVIDTAEQLNWQIDYFGNQAEFLLEHGISEIYEALFPELSAKEQAILAQNLKKILLPTEMGELFKVISIKSPAFPCP